MLKQAFYFLATAILSLSSSGAIFPVSAASVEPLHAERSERMEQADYSFAKIKKYLFLHLLDVEYFTTISITLLAIILGTGRSLKYQKPLPEESHELDPEILETQTPKAKNKEHSSTNSDRTSNQKQEREAKTTVRQNGSANSQPIQLIEKPHPEIQEEYYREKYSQLKEQVVRMPRFADNPILEMDDWEVDVEIALTSLSKSPNNLEEAKQILRQSDRGINWEISLPRQEYEKKISDYVEKVLHWARDVRQLRAGILK